MKGKSIRSLLLSLCAVALFSWAAAYSMDAGSLRSLVTGDSAEAARAAGELSDIPFDSLFRLISGFNDYPVPEKTGRIVALHHPISDSIDAPVYIWLPISYNPNVATPLVVYLHGGVSRPEFIAESEMEWEEDPIVKLCEEQGWLMAFPMARRDCLWWNRTGMDHLLWLVRELKRRFNIDDGRVMLGGFSDGGSGSFHLALLAPTDFAHFYPWSGFIAVGTLVGEMPVYLPNLGNRVLFAANGGRDQLYPAEKMLPLMRLALEEGAGLYFTVYDTAGHNDGYLGLELLQMGQRAEDFPRQPLRPHLYWEASDLHFGRVDWLQITGLDTAAQPAAWHREVNYAMVDDQIRIGFFRNNEWEGEGMLVDSLVADTASPAHMMGMLPGDIVVGLDDVDVKSVDDYLGWRDNKKRGDEFTVTVLRDGARRLLSASLPPPKEQEAFPHEAPSGAIDALRIGNHFEVQASRISGFRIFVHPEMVRLDQPVTVVVNGVTRFEGLVEPDSRFMLAEFLRDRDRRLLWAGKIDIGL